MTWYSTGTVTVTNNNATVTGSGTDFVANARTGDAFNGPDGRWYEITNIASATAMSISPNYQGSTASGAAYKLAPLQGYVKASADLLRQFVNNYGAQLENLGTMATQDADNVTIGNLSVTGNATYAGNMTFTMLGVRLTADMSNSTFANRFAFQTSTVNGATSLTVLPNGTGTVSGVNLYSSSDPANAGRARLSISSTGTVALASEAFGSGTVLPLSVVVGAFIPATFDISGNTAFSGNVSFTGSAKRLIGDFSNTTVASRVMFKTSTANGATRVEAIPDGTGTTCNYAAYNNSDPTNASGIRMTATSSNVRLESIVTGTGSYAVMDFYNGGAIRYTIPPTGPCVYNSDVQINAASGQASLYFSQASTVNGRIYAGGGGGTDVILTSGRYIGFQPAGGKVDILQTNSGVPTQIALTSANGGGGQTGIFARPYQNDSTTYGEQASIRFLDSNFSADTAFFTKTPGAAANTAVERARLNSYGRFLLGTTSDDATNLLQVNGTIKGSQGLRVGNAAQAAADVLDWYEEGTFTPTVAGATTAGSATYTAQQGRFQRIGNRVYFNIYLAYSGHTGTGAPKINGLPYTVTSSSSGCTTALYVNGWAYTSGNMIQAYITAGTSIFFDQRTPAGSSAGMSLPAAASALIITGHYEV